MAVSVFADRLAGDNIRYLKFARIVKTDMTAKVKDTYDKLIADGMVPQNDGAIRRYCSRASLPAVTGTSQAQYLISAVA